MAPVVAEACSTDSGQMSPAISVQETGSGNKKKFTTDLPISEESSAEKHPCGCEMCTKSQDNFNDLTPDIGTSCAIGPSDMVPSDPEEEIATADELKDADWSDLSESQLEELVLDNLDTILKSALRQIMDFGYTEDIATKAVLRSDGFYGCEDTVTNIVDHALAYLRHGQELDSSKEIKFEDLRQLEKFILAEWVCILRAVRPSYSTGDAKWCLLVCDMNVTLACAMDTNTFSSLVGDRAPNEVRTEVKSSENLPNVSRPNRRFACACHSETPTMASAPCMHGSQPKLTVTTHPNLMQKTSAFLNGLVQEKEIQSSPDKSFVAAGKPNTSFSEEKFCTSSKIPGIIKREYILRHKSLQLEKSCCTNGSRGASRSRKLSSFGGLILDEKLKSVEDSTGISVRNATLKVGKAMEVNLPQDSLLTDISTTNAFPPKAFNLETVKNTMSALPEPNCLSTIKTINSQPALPAADTELSLSLPTKSHCPLMPTSFNFEAPKICRSTLSNEKLSGQWVPQDKKDEMVINLVPRVQELQNQLQEWTEWANQKVMQAARILSKDRAELKTLKQEKEEAERLKKEKQTLEESTMKKLSEMENALCKASRQVEQATAAVRRLEVEKATLRKEMEAATSRALESGASCQEVSKREKKTLMQIESWEKQITLVQEELVAEKRRMAQLQHEMEEAKDVLDQLEARWKQGERANEELLTQASSFRNTREQLEASAKSKENMVRLKVEKNMHRYKDDIEKLEKEISQLRLKTDASKIAALRRGVDGSYANRLTDSRIAPTKVSSIPLISRKVTYLQDHSGSRIVKRERECVMCLSEEMSVVFLPCAHMVVCTTCNEIHEKQGMMDCPSCRGRIMRRVSVRHAPS